MVHVLNNYFNEANSERMGESAIYITDNFFATETKQYTQCTEFFLEGGFKNLSNCKGRYLILRRKGLGMASWDTTINEIRAYSVPNLLEGAVII